MLFKASFYSAFLLPICGLLFLLSTLDNAAFAHAQGIDYTYHSIYYSCKVDVFNPNDSRNYCGGFNCNSNPDVCGAHLVGPLGECSCHDGCLNNQHGVGCCPDYETTCSDRLPPPPPSPAPTPLGPPVDCGGHTAARCSDCPFSSSGEYYYGLSWCHGECVWDQDDYLDMQDVSVAAQQCRNKRATDVDCGYYQDHPPKDRDGFFRPTCSDCMDYSDPSYCAGDCFEKNGECLPK